VTEQRREFAELGIGPGQHGLAVDLGCGPGHQAAALADLGFGRVVALDTSQILLDELIEHRGERPIEPICDDILKLAQYVPKDSIDVVVCMGDTLPHLESVAQVRALAEACWQALRPSGRLLLTFRDYSQALQGLDRIIPARLDADKAHDLHSGLRSRSCRSHRPHIYARRRRMGRAQKPLPQAQACTRRSSRAAALFGLRSYVHCRPHDNDRGDEIVIRCKG
jgi:SAM-dependent methyltransferase